MRSLFAALALLVFSLPLAAQQSGTVSFTAATTGAPTSGACATATPATCGHRLFRDGTALGAVTAGQANTVQNLFPAATGTWTFAVESWNNAACSVTGLPACNRTTAQVTLGPAPPGEPVSITISAPCATANPPTCVITVTP